MSPPNISIPKGPVMTPLASQENALAAYTKTPPRKIRIDPKSARTVIHEIRAHHNGAALSDSSPDELFPHAPPQLHINGNDAAGKAGILPDRNHYIPPRRSKSRHRRRNYDTDSDADSESDNHLKPTHPRRRQRSNSDQSRSSHNSRTSNRPPSDRHHSNELTRDNNRQDLALAPQPRSRSHSTPPSSDSDSGYDSTAHERDRRAARNKKILYTGLATITTVAAANGLYQNTKGFHGRRNAFKEADAKGELADEEERKRRRRKHLMMDAFGMLVVGVGVNNVRVGWQRREEKRRAHEAVEERARERFERRERGRGGCRAYSVEEI